MKLKVITKTMEEVKRVEVGETVGNGFFISWDRLTEHLRVSNALNQRETIKGLDVDQDGLHVYVSTGD